MPRLNIPPNQVAQAASFDGAQEPGGKTMGFSMPPNKAERKKVSTAVDRDSLPGWVRRNNTGLSQ